MGPGNDVSHVTDPNRKSRAQKRPCPEGVRKYVLRMPGFSPRFFLTIVVVQVPWLPKGWKGVHMHNQKLRKICHSGTFCPEVRVPAFFLSTEGWGDLYDVRVIYLAWLLELAISVLYLAWLQELALVIYPFPAILFSYNIYIYIYICCVVLQVFLLNNQYFFVNFLSITTFLDSFFLIFVFIQHLNHYFEER